MNKRFNNIWKELKKIGDPHSLYNLLLLGCLALVTYIYALFNYAESLEQGGDPNASSRSNWYYRQLYLFDAWFGKTATIIILGVLTLIPFILAIRIYRKQKKAKENETKKENNHC